MSAPFPLLGRPIAHPTLMDVVGPAIVLTALLLLAVGAYFGGKSIYLLDQGQTTQGTVVDVKLTMKGVGSPVVEFTTRAGERVHIESSHGSRPPLYRVGAEVDVHYLESHPEFAAIDSFEELWFMPVALGPAGVVLGGLGIGMWVIGRRRKRARERARLHGWHLPAVVVGSNSRKTKRSTRYAPVVEARHPEGVQLFRCTGDETTSPPVLGTWAMVHVDPAPPHGYVVDFKR